MLDEKVIIAHTDPKSPISEAYRVLRTNIQYSSFDNPLKTIVVTSSGPMEGKTTTVINLAITFAQMSSKVLLIDSDLRKPRVHQIFGFGNRNGLTNFLANHDEDKDYKECIRSCDIANLDIMTCGAIPPNPSELLESNSMKQFIQTVRGEYDMVFLDAPPVGNVTDAAIISTFVDGTILVASSGTVEIDAIKRAKELLMKVNANIIGVVLNKLDKRANNNNYYNYYSEDGRGKPYKRRNRRKNNKNNKNNKKSEEFPTPSDVL